MPPIRSLTATKPIKTERTHEENQERAYIAASRRSDRSLEARIESARRASEIHKRRTGRSLRVTEQDVINEEMYEEEDDDLPSQYRRYAANFNTNSAEFNRKVQAYLQNHVAVNTALNQAMNGQPMTGQYNQQFPMNQPWGQQGMNPMQQQMWQQQQMQQQYNQQMIAQQMMHNANNNNFKQTSFPSQFQMPQQQNFRPVMPQRNTPLQQNNNNNNNMAARTAPTSKHVSPVLSRNDDSRRLSAPIAPPSSSISPRSQAQSGGLSNAQRTGSATSLPALPVQSASILPTTETSPVQEQSMWAPSANMDMGPLTTSLPAETQMFLGVNPGGFAMNNVPLNTLNMNSFFGTGTVDDKSQQQPFYSYNPNNYNKGRNMHPSFDGMSQTLAPGALDNTADPINWTTPGSASTLSNDSAATPFSSTFTPGFADPMMGNNDMFKLQQQYNMASPMAQPSGFITPGEADWSAFIDSSSWDEVATTT